MNILFLQLSDIHISKRQDGFAVNTEKIVQAINYFPDVDQCIIIVSGDITQNGNPNEFKVASDMLGNLLNKLKEKKFKDKFIKIVIVPGNHDLDLTSNKRSFENIIDAFKAGSFSELYDKDIVSLENFYEFASRSQCFTDDKIISHSFKKLGNFRINFVLINTAPFSLEGSTNQDMGTHYLSAGKMGQIIPETKADLNIAVMHHSSEWFATNLKVELNHILCNNFSIVFFGHEHDAIGEQRKINNKNTTIFLQGNSLSGDRTHAKGFIAAIYNTHNRAIKGYSFTWDKNIYKPETIVDGTLEEKSFGKYIIQKEFLKYLNYDDNQRLMSQYFVFPSLSYNITKDDNDIDTKIINDIEHLVQLVLGNNKTVITGDSKAGKSTLGKVLFKYFADNEMGVTPLLLQSETLKSKRVDNIVEEAFKGQYEIEANSFDMFLQLDKSQRVLIIDDVMKIQKISLDYLFEYMDKLFDYIVLLSEEKIDLDIQKKVIDALSDKKTIEIIIKPFLYDKRKLLISKAYNLSNLSGSSGNKANETVDAINNMISSQVRFFRLDPEFIINYVLQYTEKFKMDFTPGKNIFNIVYETAIKNRIIKNSQEEHVNGIFAVMGEIAYQMHFEKKTWIEISEVSEIVTKYNHDFRQSVKISILLDTGEKAKLFIEKDSKIKFKDNNLLAYFAAYALNTKYHFDESNEVNEKIIYLLDNICYSINSDIILFMSFITNNPKIINVVVNCATNHFKDMDEFSFDKNNIPLLCRSDFEVKKTFPSEKERKEKENQLVKQEEELKASELIELVEEYDYDEEDIKMYENQIIKSIKFLEILSKILPSFSHNMKADQQDEIAKALYSYPNRFIFQWLNDICENFDEFVEDVYEKITELRNARNMAMLHIDDIRKMLEDSAVFVFVNLYQLVAATATTNQTITALNAFDYSSNTNYKLMNLMMVEKTANQKDFRQKAFKLYDNTDIKLVKSMVKFTVRNFFLNHNDLSLVGETQSLFDKFFGASEVNNLEKRNAKIEIAKHKFKRR